jgi:PLP dependent protein
MCPTFSRTAPDRRSGGEDPRLDEIARNLVEVRDRVAAVCARVGRDPDQVTIIAVTKTFPAADVIRLARLGIPDIGENRDQEAGSKLAEVAAAGVPVRCHFVGRLQRNKARSVVRYAHTVHSVDSVRLARSLGAAAEQAVRAGDRVDPVEVLVQVSLNEDPARGGAPASEVPRVADVVVSQEGLRLRGVMAVAPLSWQPLAAYGRLAEVARDLQADHAGATAISAGMSSDLDAALACGATHLRLGTALLGKRPPLR